MAIQYAQSTIDSYVDYAVRAFARGEGLVVTSDPSTGEYTGLVAIPSGGNAARYIADQAERRTSTLNH